LKKFFGFSLVELNVVLVILGLILAMFLPLLSSQLEHSRYMQVKRDLLEIKEALLGYAQTNGALPCPDSNSDGIVDTCMNANVGSATEGGVPWATLAINGKDPWGRPYQYRVNNGFTTAFLLSTVGSGSGIIKICADANCQKVEASNVPFVVYSKGKNGGFATLGSDENENADLDGIFVSHDPVQNGFDDLLVWASNNVLMNRMVSVGKLP